MATKTATKNAKSTRDELVLQLLKDVAEQKAAIEKAGNPTWETNLMFRFNADQASNTININTVTDTRKLVEILGFLIDRESNFEKAKSILGVEGKFTWLGFSLAEWQSDLVTRANIINIQAKRKQLAELDAKLNSLVSKETREELELQALAALVNAGKK